MISLVIPTYNEKEGLPLLVKKIFEVLKSSSIEGEVVIVDDNSPDGTGEAAEALGKEYPIQVIHRSGKLGLSSAVIEGFKKAKGEILGVMDADFSHDPGIIPDLVNAIVKDGADIAIGSRYIKGGGIRNWPFKRVLISKVAVLLAKPLTPVKDITSGYLFIRKEVIENVKLNPIGFKILLEIIIKGKYKKYMEVPYTFVDRAAGKSKMNSKEVVNYLIQLVDLAGYKFFGRHR